MNKRLNFIDVSKGISIILVILGHIDSLESGKFKLWFYSFHMPIFFIISGYLSHYNKEERN